MQESKADPPSMKELIYKFDWSSTPLGPLEGWPQSLKTAVDLIIASPVANILVCGPKRVLIYNEACIPLYGTNHPEALGAEGPKAFPELWEEIAPHFDRVFAGEALSFKAQPWTFDQADIAPEGLYDAYFTPGRDESGTIAFAHVTAIEVTDQVRAEAALRESNEHFFRLFAASPAPFLVLKADSPRFTIIDVNDAYLASTLRTRENLIGSGMFEAFPDNPDDPDADGVGNLRASLERTVTLRRPDTMPVQKYDIVGPDGCFEPRWWSPVNSPVIGQNGEVDAIIHHVFDVSEKRRAEIILRESEERQAFLLKLSDALRPLGEPAAVAETACRMLVEHLNASRAQFTEVEGEAGAEIVRVRGEHVRSGPPMAWRYPLAAFGESLLAGLRGGEPLILTDTSRDASLTNAERDAFAAVASAAAMAIPLVKEGRTVAAITVHDASTRDWSDAEVALVREVAERAWATAERVRAKQALRESEQSLRLIVGSARDYAIFTTDTAGKVDNWHQGAEAVFGYSADEIIGQDASILFTPEDRAAGEAERELDAARAEGSAPDIRWHLRKDGSRVFIEGRTAALRNDDGVFRGFLKIGQDVTERIEAEAAMRDSEERLRLSLQAGRLATWDWNLTTGAMSWNDEHFRMQGYMVGEVDPSYETWAARVHPNDLEDTVVALNTAAERREHYRHEFRMLLPGGMVRWCAAQGTYFYDDRGNAVRMIGVMEDVTERRQFEQALFQSEERFRQFAENSAGVLWIADATEAPPRLEFLSAAFERIWGASRQDVIGSTAQFLNFVHADDREQVSNAMSRLVLGENHTLEYRIIRPDTGHICWISDAGFPVRDRTGQIIRVAGIAQDITDRKRADEAVRESQRRLRALVEGVPQLVWRAVRDGEWVWASPQWSAFTGQPAEQSHGYGWLEMVHQDDQRAAMTAWERAKESGGFEMTGRLKKSDGTYRWFQTRATPVRDEDDTIIEWLGTCTDINDLQRLQDQQKVLVAELQHRTRNLLAVVRSVGGQTLKTSTSLKDFNERFNDRLSALSRVQGLLSRSEQEPITLGALIHAELDALGASIDTGRVTFEGPEVALRNSTVQTLSLALHELATNARKYGALSNDQGILTVQWSVREDEESSILDIEWLEENQLFPAKQQTREGGGFGRNLIERALPYTLKAETNYVLDEKGVRCRISLPIKRRESDRS